VDDVKLVVLVLSMILERPTCAQCISGKVNATKMDTLLAMRRIAGILPVEMQVGERCRVCGSTLDPVHVAARR
jgi:hypothetical protein